MNKRGAVLFVLLAVATATEAQFMPTAQNARQGALGGCHLPQKDEGTRIGTSWRQGFMAQGCATRRLDAAANIGRRGFTHLGYSHFGNVTYHEQQTTLAIGMDVCEWLRIVIDGIYSHLGTNDMHYGTQQWLDAGLCIQATAGKKIDFYFDAQSRRWDNRRTIGGHAGFGYKALPTLTTVGEIAFEERTRLRCGMEYLCWQHLAIRGGLATNPLVLTFGAGYASDHYHIDMSTEVHPVLGLSPQITLGICL